MYTACAFMFNIQTSYECPTKIEGTTMSVIALLPNIYVPSGAYQIHLRNFVMQFYLA